MPDALTSRAIAVAPSALMGKSALTRIVAKVFRGSPELLLTHLVSDRSLTAAELKRMRKLLDDRLREEES